MAAVEGAIQADVVYPIKTFKEITGLGDWAMREARKNGLRVLRRGGRGFVIGRDFIEWIESADDDSDEQGCNDE